MDAIRLETLEKEYAEYKSQQSQNANREKEYQRLFSYYKKTPSSLKSFQNESSE
jgi:hypothetical protein